MIHTRNHTNTLKNNFCLWTRSCIADYVPLFQNRSEWQTTSSAFLRAGPIVNLTHIILRQKLKLSIFIFMSKTAIVLQSRRLEVYKLYYIQSLGNGYGKHR